ncbi:MAG: hypothetical protein ACI9W2_003839 [Gammaproteobacteria bacterium]|jgi:hypothetical protein
MTRDRDRPCAAPYIERARGGQGIACQQARRLIGILVVPRSEFVIAPVSPFVVAALYALGVCGVVEQLSVLWIWV